MTAVSNHDGNNPRSEGALRWIGDLDHPFYSDERNRYVWYEASAIGFQMALLGAYMSAGLVLWFGGEWAVLYGLAVLVPILTATVVFQMFLKKHHAQHSPQLSDFRRVRGPVSYTHLTLPTTPYV